MKPNTEWGSATSTSSASERSTETAIEDLVLVSNRQPYRHHYPDGGDEIDVESPAGGLTAGLDPVMRRLDGTWVAWGDGEADEAVVDEDDRVGVPPSDPEYTLQRVWLSEDEVRGYYDGYANQALWPLCHSTTGRLNFEADHWEYYRAVNEEFADAVAAHADPGTTVWFQDYHFTLAPRLVAEREPEAFVMHFFHIPWPCPDLFRVCPHRRELLDGMLGSDLLGFHLPEYGDHFLRCADAILDDATVDWGERQVHFRDGVTSVRAFPLGIDADAAREHAEDGDAARSFWDGFRNEHGIADGTSVAIGVDRLDYTKGIPQRLEMLEHLFETRPGLRGELTYVQKGSESRSRIPAYQRLQERVASGIDHLNDRFGTDDWRPVVYTTEMYDRDELGALYRHSDLALVTPVRDGMNLVAKEYVASQVDNDGVLLLSRLTGAHEQLGDAAVTVDPFDTAGGAEAIEYALAMDDEERRERMRALRETVHRGDLSAWLRNVLGTARDVQRERASPDKGVAGGG